MIAVLTVLGVLILGVVGLKTVSFVLKHNDSTTTSSPSIPTYTATSTEPTEPTVGPSSQSVPTATRPTTTRPTTQPPRPTTSRSTTTTSKPTTKPGPSDSDLVLKNSLYAKGGTMASVHCKESKSRPSTAAGARANYKNLLACLNKAWAPIITKAGGRFRAPRLIAWSGSVTSPCGTYQDSYTPFTCSTNDTIYMNMTEDLGNYNRYSQSYQKIWARMWMLHQFAHEYGHHVQINMGIMQASWRIRYERPTEAMELQDSRRLELQASCFSDIFIGANRSSYPVTGEAQHQWRWLIGHVTDLKNDHGDANNHQYWALRGYNSRNPSVCNTYAASAAKVQ